MLKSLYAGVSGLRNHQTKLDVLGNNIANVNTIGFKGDRIVFSEALTQAFSGGTNRGSGSPMQIGLGMQVGSVDRIFNQGSFETTGNLTDLAIEGDGFFVLTNGESRFYSRAGNFQFGQDGRLMSNAGLSVQGWLFNGSAASVNTGLAELQDIQIDASLQSEAQPTENIYLSGNIDAGLTPKAEVWSMTSSFTTRATVTGAAIPGAVTVTGGVNDQFVVAISGTGTPISEELTLTANTYATVDDLVTEINTQIAGNATLAGSIEAINSGGAVKFRYLGTSSNATVTINSGTNDVLTDIGYTSGTSGTTGGAPDTTTELNDLVQMSTAFVTGDTIEINGSRPDGTAISGTFTYGTDGTTIQDLLTSISATFPEATATLVDGQIQLTDDSGGDSQSNINLVLGSGNTGSVLLPSFSVTTEGFTGKVSSSVVVYDSLGAAHNLIIEYTKTDNAGEWLWEIQTTGDEEILGGGSGTVTFDNSGQLAAFTYDNNDSALMLDPGNAAAVMNLNINAQGDETFSGITQFDAGTTIYIRDQDGRATGQLLGLAIDRNGVITGSFSNGESVDIAQIALARFANNQGLVNIGDGLNESTSISGQPEILNLSSAEGAAVASGALEMSNVDLSKEFTELIVAQRGFQANAKVITTADTILDELIRIKR